MNDTAQPKPLILADKLDLLYSTLPDAHIELIQSVKELLRLHARNAELEREKAALHYKAVALEVQLYAIGAGGVEPLRKKSTAKAEWPSDADDVRLFMNNNCESVEYAIGEYNPSEGDRYQLTAHDFLSAVNWWADFPHRQTSQAQEDASHRKVLLSEVIDRLEQGFGAGSAPVTTLLHYFGEDAEKNKD